MSCDEEGKEHFPDLMLTLLFTHILGKDWWAGKKKGPVPVPDLAHVSQRRRKKKKV